MMKTIFFVLACILSFSVNAVEVTPTESFNQSLSFADDMNFENMDLAVERQLKSFARKGLKGSIQFGKDVYPKTVLKESLLLLKDIFSEALACRKTRPETECLAEVNRAVNGKFAFYRPVPGKGESGYGKGLTKFTSYYSPDLHGSRVPTARFNRPIYRRPKTPADRSMSRVEIDYHGGLAGKGLEIFWVEESIFDIYLLHVEGGARVHVSNPDGSSELKYLSYDSSNGRPFQMLYKYMLKKKYITNASVENQRKFILENPAKGEEIFGICPNYIFFRESSEEPVGVNSTPLTEGRSLAVDTRIYRTVGMINFVKTVKADARDGRVVKRPFSRFFLAQDTGGAIRGNARCDLYSGYGREAERIAYNMNELGEQYILIKRP